LECPGEFTGYVTVLGAPNVEIYFLQENNVGLGGPEEIKNRRELEAPLDIPIQHSNVVSRTGLPSSTPEAATDHFIHRRDV